MKLEIPLVPVIAATATYSDIENLLKSVDENGKRLIKRPFKRRLAKVLGLPKARMRAEETNVEFILIQAEKDLPAVIEKWIDIANSRNQKFALLNFAIAILKQRFKEKLNEILAREENLDLAFDLAWEQTIEETEDEILEQNA